MSGFTRYAEAIEGQLALLRFAESDKGKRLMRALMGGSQDKPIPWEITSVMGLETGQTYFWDPAMCGMLQNVSPDMPDWALTHTTLPAPSGFFWFSKPLAMPVLHDKNGNAIADDLWGMSWVSVCRAPDGGSFIPVAGPVDQADYIALSMYSPIGGASPVPSVNWYWDFDQPLSEAVKRSPDAYEELTITRVLRLRYFAAALAFLQQRILIAEPRPLDRSTRRRLPATWTNEPLVRVIQLRRRSAPHHLTDNRDMPDWSCRWIVRGHWRQQPYPAQGFVQPKWIMPFLKGPEDKPLKTPRATVFAVVR
jgi:hypothetical protein